ncbi:hypothetical protein C8R46DRAFT_1201604 [Mycena filopes]|nr:hypothetical protein C8R46DRAFT_1201604 [Mycena filopes]
MLPPLEFPPDEPDAINGLPDELLATILKIAADFPPFALHRALPFPVVASRVSRRWHTIAVGSPELWTNIKIFDNARSLHWAAVFARRSQPYPLDISINLQPYGPNIKHPSDPGYNVQDKVLALVGPHIGRWRTFALRGWACQLESTRQFILQSPLAPSRLESLHLDELRLPNTPDDDPPVPLDDFFRGGHLRSLRVAIEFDECMLASFSVLQSLDIPGYGWILETPEFGHLLGTSSTLTTLVLRDVYPPHTRIPGETPIIAATIRSLSIRFHRMFAWCSQVGHAFDSVTSKFLFPNLESLEIVDGFSGDDKEDKFIKVPEPWEAPLFPHLRTLRLETLGFSRKGLALIQSFSPDITHLELIHITNNHELLLERTPLQAWPALRTITFEETKRGAAKWISVLLSARAYIGHKPLEELTIPQWGSISFYLPNGTWPEVNFQYDGPSSGLTESAFGCGTSSYLDYGSLRGMDFEKLWDVRREYYDDWDVGGPGRWQYDEDPDAERLEAEIEEALRMEGALVREKSMLRASRRHKPKLVSKKRKPKARRRQYDLREDFCVAR